MQTPQNEAVTPTPPEDKVVKNMLITLPTELFTTYLHGYEQVIGQVIHSLEPQGPSEIVREVRAITAHERKRLQTATDAVTRMRDEMHPEVFEQAQDVLRKVAPADRSYFNAWEKCGERDGMRGEGFMASRHMMGALTARGAACLIAYLQGFNRAAGGKVELLTGLEEEWTLAELAHVTRVACPTVTAVTQTSPATTGSPESSLPDGIPDKASQDSDSRAVDCKTACAPKRKADGASVRKAPRSRASTLP